MYRRPCLVRTAPTKAKPSPGVPELAVPGALWIFLHVPYENYLGGTRPEDIPCTGGQSFT